MKYNLNYGDKKSSRYFIIKVSINEYLQQQQSQSGSGLNQNTRATSTSKSSICIFLPSDPDELVDHLKLV